MFSSANLPQRLFYDVFAFDQFTLNQLRLVRANEFGEPIEVYTFFNDPRDTDTNKVRDWGYTLLSLIKVVEIVVLWNLGARVLCWSTLLPWLFFFISAAILQYLNLSRGYNKGMRNGELDILFGELPPIVKGGGNRKLLLGAPRNFRQHFLWYSTWTVGIIVCAVCLVTTYALLGRQKSQVVYTWLCFQIAFMLLRTFVFQLAESSDALFLPFRREGPLEQLPVDSTSKVRALELMFALAKYRAELHPRGSWWYSEDPKSASQVRAIFAQSGNTIAVSFPDPTGVQLNGAVSVDVVGIIGDCLLGSAAWFQGFKLAGIEAVDDKQGLHLYDSCLVTIRFNNAVMTIPAARALCAPSAPIQNVSQAEQGNAPLTAHVPRGAPIEANLSNSLVLFYYWIPCSRGRWLQICSSHTRLLGERQAFIKTDEQITALFDSRILNIAKWTIEEMKGAVETSRIGGESLMRLIT